MEHHLDYSQQLQRQATQQQQQQQQQLQHHHQHPHQQVYSAAVAAAAGGGGGGGGGGGYPHSSSVGGHPGLTSAAPGSSSSNVYRCDGFGLGIYKPGGISDGIGSSSSGVGIGGASNAHRSPISGGSSSGLPSAHAHTYAHAHAHAHAHAQHSHSHAQHAQPLVASAGVYSPPPSETTTPLLPSLVHSQQQAQRAALGEFVSSRNYPSTPQTPQGAFATESPVSPYRQQLLPDQLKHQHRSNSTNDLSQYNYNSGRSSDSPGPYGSLQRASTSPNLGDSRGGAEYQLAHNYSQGYQGQQYYPQQYPHYHPHHQLHLRSPPRSDYGMSGSAPASNASATPTNHTERPRLSEQEKKNNHIASEQKRRLAIREGFDRLTDIVPGLEGQGRSEAIVLKKSVTHLQDVLAERQQLIDRIQELGGHVPADLR